MKRLVHEAESDINEKRISFADSGLHISPMLDLKGLNVSPTAWQCTKLKRAELYSTFAQCFFFHPIFSSWLRMVES